MEIDRNDSSWHPAFHDDHPQHGAGEKPRIIVQPPGTTSKPPPGAMRLLVFRTRGYNSRRRDKVSVETSGVGADRRAAARPEASRTRGGGSSTPGEIVAPGGFRNRNYNSRLTPKS